jgi:hypothetical protein
VDPDAMGTCLHKDLARSSQVRGVGAATGMVAAANALLTASPQPLVVASWQQWLGACCQPGLQPLPLHGRLCLCRTQEGCLPAWLADRCPPRPTAARSETF